MDVGWGWVGGGAGFILPCFRLECTSLGYEDYIGVGRFRILGGGAKGG